jgi:hypothetical protein
MKIINTIRNQLENRSTMYWIMCGLFVLTLTALVTTNCYILNLTHGHYNIIDILFM